MQNTMLELAPYAVLRSQGRRFSEEPPALRSEFQRDRDRIVHSTAFRRLEYKTQVFVNHEGDLFRTRLTHTLEVTQLARAVTSALRLNEDLAEAISLAHDLGHTPFGHAGQDALNECMQKHGGFEHNLQSLRTVDYLEERYAEFRGLNLCFETREGIVKHCPPDKALQLRELGERFINNTQPSLEAQVCNLADGIAYNNHDVDDGLRSGLISVEQLEEVSLFRRHIASVRVRYPKLSQRRLIHETIRRMINALVCDLIEATASNIAKEDPGHLFHVAKKKPLVRFSDEIHEAQLEIKKFLSTHLYQHYRVLRMTAKAHRIVCDLFCAFISDPRLLPSDYRDEEDQPRRVADYVAGMTDRYAMKEHRRLFAVEEI